MAPLAAFVRAADRLAVMLAVLGALCLGAAAAATVADVIVRPFGLGLRGVVDIVQLCVMTGVFLGMPYTFFSEGHVRVELLLEALPTRLRKGLLTIVDLVAIAFLVLLSLKTFEGFESALARNDISMNIALPMALFWGPMAAGLALSVLTSAALVFKRLLNIPTPEREQAEV
ncbi:TRAP transporter small permease [Fodinicurvata sp. EGI_FJ10296]|jgi:TRAP-type C4-dicarboxylate transport system permease small subunit|uniref:TRAP transporter small permease n=1 Tax=Fodinicurvata sp. EGI_FJ10296 TaxID=3231908 RepID=UPI003455339C